MPIKELCRSGGFSDATFYKWRAKYGGMQASDAGSSQISIAPTSWAESLSWYPIFQRGKPFLYSSISTTAAYLYSSPSQLKAAVELV